MKNTNTIKDKVSQIYEKCVKGQIRDFGQNLFFCSHVGQILLWSITPILGSNNPPCTGSTPAYVSVVRISATI